MSKLKIIDMNKQMLSRSTDTVARMEDLQNSVQNHLATLKRIEAELIRIARAEAEENRLRAQQEEEQQAKEMQAAEEADKARQAAQEEKAKPVKKARAVEAGEPATEKVKPAVIENTAAESTPEKPKAEEPGENKAEPQQQKNEAAKETRQPVQSGEFRRPQGQSNDFQRPQGQQRDMRRPQEQRGQYGDFQRPQGQQGQPRDFQRTPGQQGPRDYQRTPGQQGPRDYQRTPGQQGPRDFQRTPGQQSRPFGYGAPGQRGPAQTGAGRPMQRTPGGVRRTPEAPTPDFVPVEKRSVPTKKYQSTSTYAKDDKNKKSRKTLLKEQGAFNDSDDRYRKKRSKFKLVAMPAPIVVDRITMTTEMISVKSLAEKTGKPVADLLKKLMLLGMMCTINSELDIDTAQLICAEFKISIDYKLDKTAEDVLGEGDIQDTEASLITRPPIVTIMGHVDHGKTSLLDAIRETRVTEHEAGGITQHIGAYTIKHNGQSITFLDTPGHEAFTAMRARGAQVTDIAILVVAADDGVMPQTVEAINHAKAAGVPIIVAINKIDKPNANPEKVKQGLTEYGLVAEEWGGDAVMVPVSAVTKEGLDHLIEMILLVAEVQELKANPNRLAKGTIVEAKLDKGRGPVATVLVQNGTLHISDMIVAGTAYGRVRAMLDDLGNRVEEASPSQPVEVVGFSEVPVAGDTIYAVEQDKLTRQVAEERKDKQKADMLKNLSKMSLDELFSQVAEGKLQELNIVIKADVQGSVEAVKQALEKLANKDVRVKVIHAGVGAIKAMDVMLASASNAIIIGFNVRPDVIARAEAEKEKVEIRLYRVIYKAIEDIELAMKGMLAPEFKEAVLGHAEVRTTFSVSSIGTIAGSYVTDGKIVKTASVRLLRDNIVVHEGSIASLKRFKDDAKEVNQGYECGITLKNFNDVKEGDVIEAFEMQEIKG
jgi:translation initiation factor IF-2